MQQPSLPSCPKDGVRGVAIAEYLKDSAKRPNARVTFGEQQRSSARADDLAQTLASIRRQLRRIPTDHRRRAELFATLTYVARLYVRREIRSAPRPQTPEDALRGAGIDDARPATYQRRLSMLLAGAGEGGARDGRLAPRQ